MASDKEDGGPAFPIQGQSYPRSGMSLRDWFAGQALVGLIARSSVDGAGYKFSNQAYQVADAMLAQRVNR